MAEIFLVVMLLGYIVFLFKLKRENRSTRAIDVPWGEDKDLSSLLPKRELQELEQWWNTTQSDKARIKHLQGTNALLQSKINAT